MQERGITPSVVKDVIDNRLEKSANNGAIRKYNDQVEVIINSEGKVLTVIAK